MKKINFDYQITGTGDIKLKSKENNYKKFSEIESIIKKIDNELEHIENIDKIDLILVFVSTEYKIQVKNISPQNLNSQTIWIDKLVENEIIDYFI